jgi:hypothetical protein
MITVEVSEFGKRFVDPDGTLDAQFPASRSCVRCKTKVILQSRDDLFLGPLMVQSKDDILPSRTLNWECPACKSVTIFTKDDNFVRAFRGKSKGKDRRKTREKKKRSRRDMLIFAISCVLVAVFLIVGQFL